MRLQKNDVKKSVLNHFMNASENFRNTGENFRNTSENFRNTTGFGNKSSQSYERLAVNGLLSRSDAFSSRNNLNHIRSVSTGKLFKPDFVENGHNYKEHEFFEKVKK